MYVSANGSPRQNDSELTSEELMQHYVETGDQASFKVLFDRHYDELCLFIFNRYVRDRGACEDIAQQAFTAVHLAATGTGPGKAGKDKAKYDGRPFAKWLFWLGGNKAINYSTENSRLKRKDGPLFSLNQRITSEDTDDNGDNDLSLPDGVDEQLEAKSETIEVFSEEDDDTLEFHPEAVFEAVSALPEPQQTVITRIFYENVSERDVAEELGVTRHQVRRLLQEAQAALKDAVLDNPLTA